MTCIVGIEHDGKVTIGGDSAGVAGLNLTVRSDEKVWERDGFAFGFTSSFRMGQLLRYSLKLPDQRLLPDVDDDEAVYRWMVNDFIDAVRTCLKSGGWMQVDRSVERGGVFLVGWRGRLFQIGGDLQVGRAVDGYDAVGCGASLALGAMHALSALDDPPSPKRITRAGLKAAAFGSAGVAGPFTFATASGEAA